MSNKKKKIAIFGGGPAALMLAGVVANTHEVVIYEQQKTVGRKFLVAGKGGFNLTHDLSTEALVEHYTPIAYFKTIFQHFDVSATKQWFADLNIPTFVGTSGRVFPEKGIKPIEVLKNWTKALTDQQVELQTEHAFIGFNKEAQPIVKHQEKEKVVEADAYVFALGGASWSVTGSDGHWVNAFHLLGLKINDFQASNCGLNCPWPKQIVDYHSGKPLKNIAIHCNGQTVKGEALITDYGLEGNAIYPIVPEVRQQLAASSTAEITIDFKPKNTLPQLLAKQSAKNMKSKDYAEVFNLNKAELAILKAFSSKASFQDPSLFIQKIKRLPIPVESLRPIEEAISTIGGIDLTELNEDFSLKKYPKIYAIGEMLDWDAPTGGFLLQACFSMGHFVGRKIKER